HARTPPACKAMIFEAIIVRKLSAGTRLAVSSSEEHSHNRRYRWHVRQPSTNFVVMPSPFALTAGPCRLYSSGRRPCRQRLDTGNGRVLRGGAVMGFWAKMFFGVALFSGACLGSADGQSTFNEREVKSGVSALDKANVWALDFRFKDPRLIKVNVP